MKTSARIVLILLCLPTVVTAATVRFQQGLNGYIGTADTYIRFDQPTTRLPNSVIILVDNVFPVAHGLIRFDGLFGPGPGQIPPDASIQSATLTVRTSNDGDPVWFHRMLVPWNETNNWNELATSGPGLQADGTEMSVTPDFTFTPSDAPRVDTFGVTATVQGWFAGDFPNYGWGITNEISNGWQFDSSENATVTNRPMLEITFFSSPRPIEILTQPTNATVVEGDLATLSIVVTGDNPMYQWFKDGIPIAGATNSTHTIPLVRRSDQGNYHVAVSNYLSGPVNSSNAYLFVIGSEPPIVNCAYGANDNMTVFVVFSQIITNGSDPANYTIVPRDAGGPLMVASAVYPSGGTAGSVIVLTLDPGTPLRPTTVYTLSVGAVFNRAGDPIDPNQLTPLSLYPQAILRIDQSQIWTFEDSGNDLSDGWKAVTFDDSAWKSGAALLGFETAALPEPLRTAVNRTNGAGVVTRTHYFRTHFSYSGPSGVAVLRFRTVLDDAAALYLNGAEIFRLRLPSGPLNYLTGGTVAVGDAVYEGPFTACVRNMVNGDNVLAVETHQTGENSSDMVWGLELFHVLADPPPTCFTRQPTNQTVAEGNPVSFAVGWSCGSSVDFQWYKDGAPIPGATNPIYTIAMARPRDAGGYYAVISNGFFGAVRSATAELTVIICCRPQVTAVYGTNETVVLAFKEVTTNGLALFNFTITAADGSHDLSIDSAAYTSGTNTGTTLLLTVAPSTPMRPNMPYNIFVSGVYDLFDHPIEPVTLPIPLFPSLLIRLDASQRWRYETSGTDLSNTWYGLDYDDTAWPVGQALFDAKRPPRTEVSGELVRTMTTLSNATATAQIPTHYFRTRFSYAGSVSNIICIRPFLDDGAVYYLNGRDIFRVGLPPWPSPVVYNTLAGRTVTNATFEGPYYVAVNNLVAGQNLLAVEVHQQSVVSSDLTFGTEFGLLLTVPPPRLRIALAANGTEIVLTWNGSAVLEQAGSLSPAGWSEVQGATSGHTAPLSGSKFFRLREP